MNFQISKYEKIFLRVNILGIRIGDRWLGYLLKMLAVIIAMGIDQRTQLNDYWAMDPMNYTPWYHQMFARNRFLLLYSSMLHASSIGDEQSKKDKIEPFLNSLLKKFQDAFYPSKNLSIDEMVVKWKGRSKYKMYHPKSQKSII